MKPVQTGKILSNQQLLMLIFLASFGMMFGTFLLSLGIARMRLTLWPPPGVTPLDPWLPTISTIALITSSILVEKAYRKFQKSCLEDFRFFWDFITGFGKARPSLSGKV
jgi:heme/copper-type cytochrome/quinol oxidase subunit 3